MEKEILERIKEFVDKTPNDYELGALIRSEIRKYKSSNKK